MPSHVQISGHTHLEMSQGTRIPESSSCQRSLPEGHCSPVPFVLWYFHRKGKWGLCLNWLHGPGPPKVNITHVSCLGFLYKYGAGGGQSCVIY